MDKAVAPVVKVELAEAPAARAELAAGQAVAQADRVDLAQAERVDKAARVAVPAAKEVLAARVGRVDLGGAAGEVKAAPGASRSAESAA